jgi:hypothetical protein
MVDKGIVLAQNAALGAHTFICEAGPILPKEPGPPAEVGGEVLEEMYPQGCASIADALIAGGSGRAGSLDTVFGAQPGPAGMASKG